MADKMMVPFGNPDGTVSQEMGTRMEINDSKEPWSEYILEDGAKIRCRLSVLHIVKLDNKTSDNGDPVYVVQGHQTLSIIPKI